MAMDILRLQQGILPPNVELFWTTRNGGVSDSPFHSWNLSFGVGDEQEAVEENRLRLLSHLPSAPAWLKQVHGASVVRAEDVTADNTEADASYTYTPSVVCAIQTADCVPVLFYHTDGSGVGAAHAGWRGIVAGVLENVAATMQQQNPAPLAAVIGACIGKEHYIIGSDVYEQLKQGQSKETCAAAFCAAAFCAAAFSKATEPNHWHADLAVLAQAHLQQAGVTQVHNETLCTYTHKDLFYSARRAHHNNTKTGRQAALIYIQ